MDSPKKQSVKHLEFQLQREKLLTKDLESKVKDLHTQISQLEQVKAELRREKLALLDDAKKASRFEERIHFLVKELESKEAIINEERCRTAEAKAETKEIRDSAHSSINTWKTAEQQWLDEQATMNATILELGNKIELLEVRLQKVSREYDDTERNLRLERERTSNLLNARELLEKEVSLLHSEAEKQKNTIFGLEQKVYQLDQAGDKLRDALVLKDTEIRSLEAKLAKSIETEERMERAVTSLNDRVNVAKMTNLEGKGEKERLACDLTESRKEQQRLGKQIDSLKHDVELSRHSQDTLQKSLDELREKYTSQQYSLKEKSVEVRKHEITMSQLTVDLKKMESRDSEWSFKCSTLESDVQHYQDEMKKLHATCTEYLEECRMLQDSVKSLKVKLDQKDEELVLMQAQYEDHIDQCTTDIKSLEGEARARQEILNDLTTQLGNTNEKNTVYHTKILEESEATTKARHATERYFHELCQANRDIFLLHRQQEKHGLALELVHALCEVLNSHNAYLESQLAVQMSLKQTVDGELQIAIDDNSNLSAAAAVFQRTISEITRDLQQHKDLILQKDVMFSEIEKERNEANDLLYIKEEALNDALERISFLENSLSSHKNASDAKTKDAALLSQCQLLLVESSCDHLQGLGVSLDESVIAKTTAFVEALRNSLGYAHTRYVDLQEMNNALETKCRELSAFIDEVKKSDSRKDVLLAKSQESQQAKIQLLEDQLQMACKDSEKTTFQLSNLLKRFESDQKSHEKALLLMKSEIEKLRKGIDYEINRKCEYKSALVEAKKLRAESDEYREREKKMSAEAIRKSVEEILYWINSFDRLKTMVEASHRSGTTVPPVDADTATRLSVAMSRYSVGLQQQNVNRLPDCRGTKRCRVDFRD